MSEPLASTFGETLIMVLITVMAFLVFVAGLARACEPAPAPWPVSATTRDVTE